ncbi:hypothetical protein SAMN05444422_102321 [Halobiforma haloterrestris]|uniref:Uncharacterized protein n=1 Tax=Natronobacterium haloterrestre TaxID=148448 RepID=A0A1I1EA39_NATHA|nr:hypothetical protein [Halobiforma haloterrestris]SFB83971.1 hypothetical protein SAMN05444422_102321 [Halobiforma haloterrestris]
MTRKEDVRRRLAGGGAVSIAIAGLLVLAVGTPTAPTEVLPFAWLVVSGAALLAAGRLERLPLGVVAVGWPRVAAVGLAMLSIGSSTLGFGRLFTASDIFGLAQAALALFTALLLALAALECLLGGVGLDGEAFLVE